MQAPLTREFNLAVVNLTINDFNPSYAEDNYFISSQFTNFANSQPRIFATILHRYSKRPKPMPTTFADSRIHTQKESPCLNICKDLL
ncbi:hypothetical protein HanRHA438_Chr09g0393581 [Helianthus annuus]|nr:hypothetical protein HanRHA438_Chr09g0393581 [Helianthus annuus]